MAKKEGEKAGAEKKKAGSKKSSARKVYTLYDISGPELKRKNQSCPKCGPGFFMAIHKNRSSCGKCSYTEFKKE